MASRRENPRVVKTITDIIADAASTASSIDERAVALEQAVLLVVFVTLTSILPHSSKQ